MEKWNQYCKDGNDPDFNFRGDFNAIEDGPYYLMAYKPAVHYTMGGLHINKMCIRDRLKPQLVDGLELQHVAARAVLVRDGVPTVLLADLGEAVARFLVGLFPRDALPLTGTLLAHALLRVDVYKRQSYNLDSKSSISPSI